MKKFISLLATVAMVSSLFVSVVKADFAPVVSTASEKLSNSDFNDLIGEDIPAGYDAYLVTVSFSSLGDLDCTIKTKKHSGRKLQGFGYQMTFDNIDNVETDYVLSVDNIFGVDLTEGFTGSKFTSIFSAGSAAAAYPTTASEISNAEGLPDAAMFVVTVKNDATVVATLDTNICVITYASNTPGTEETVNHATMSPASLTFAPAGPSKVDVTSVTISGATSATVGDSVALSATVEPNNATNLEVSWTKVSGDGAVSNSGVVTANSAGDIVVKATADGVDSANYTVSFAAAAPAEQIIPPVENKSEAQNIGTTALTDLQGKAVGEFKKNYGIAKFDTAITTGDKNYFVVATDDKAEEKQFAVDFSEIGVEAENANVSFFAIVKSATHKIVSVVLKAVAK